MDKTKGNKLGFGKMALLAGVIIFGLLIVGISAYQAGFSKEIKTRDCGFFVSCEQGHAKEKVEVTHFSIVNVGAVVGGIVGTLIILGVIMLVVRSAGSKMPGIVAASIWLICLGIVVMVIASLGGAQDGHTRLVGALTDQEYACQLRAVKSFERIADGPSNCPTSRLAEEYFKND